MKATPETDGKPICIAIRDWTVGRPEDTYTGQAEASVTASADEYRKVQVRYVAPLDGNTIDVHVYRYPGEMVAGESFLVDAITVTEGHGHQRQHATRRRRHLRRMRPAVAWTGDAIEIIDQTLLPAEERVICG